MLSSPLTFLSLRNSGKVVRQFNNKLKINFNFLQTVSVGLACPMAVVLAQLWPAAGVGGQLPARAAHAEPAHRPLPARQLPRRSPSPLPGPACLSTQTHEVRTPGASPLFLSLWYPEAPVTFPGWSWLPGRALPWGSADAEAPQPVARTKISPPLPSTDPNGHGEMLHRQKPFTCCIYSSNKARVRSPLPACQDPGKAVQIILFMFLPQPGLSSLLQ